MLALTYILALMHSVTLTCSLLIMSLPQEVIHVSMWPFINSVDFLKTPKMVQYGIGYTETHDIGSLSVGFVI